MKEDDKTTADLEALVMEARRIGQQEAISQMKEEIGRVNDARYEAQKAMALICAVVEKAGRPEDESAELSIEVLAKERDMYRERAVGLAATLRIEHPAHVMGPERRCPVTHERFSACWTDSALTGSFQRCDSCSPNLVEPLADEIREHQQ